MGEASRGREEMLLKNGLFSLPPGEAPHNRALRKPLVPQQQLVGDYVSSEEEDLSNLRVLPFAEDPRPWL